MASEVPAKRATSVAGIEAESAQLIPECLSVYGVVDSGGPAALTAQSNDRRRKFPSA